MTAKAFFTVFIGYRVAAHMVGAYKLVIVRCEKNFALFLSLFAPFDNFKYYTWSKLKIKIVQMAHIRLKILQNPADFPACLR